MRLRWAAAAAAAALVALGALGPAGAASVPRWNAWLCLPNHPHDWCYVGLQTVVVSPTGALSLANTSPSSAPPVDCFYVYPSVSAENRPNADLRLQQAEKYAAIIQAARFSQVCRVFAPLYRQTIRSDGKPALAYADVLAAWKDYLAHWNDGRGVVLIGHSQGAGVLEQLIRQQVERSPAERRLLVSAVLAGGDVVVPNRSATGGTFARTPPCTSPSEIDCVVAYSSSDRTPPSYGGLEAVPKPSSEHVLCVNPAALGGGSAPITPIFAGYNSEGIVPPGSPYLRYQWVEFPGLYSARCVREGSHAWLLVTRIHHRGDPRPTVQEVDQPSEGLHAADINIVLADLVALVRSQARAWLSHR